MRLGRAPGAQDVADRGPAGSFRSGLRPAHVVGVRPGRVLGLRYSATAAKTAARSHRCAYSRAAAAEVTPAAAQARPTNRSAE